MIKVYQWKLKDDGSINQDQAGATIGKLMLGSESISENIWNDKESGFEFVHVATVYSENLEDAYRLTNSIHDAWYASDNSFIDVDPLAQEGCRSTSVGDIMQNGNGEVWVVANFGFTQLADAKPKQIRNGDMVR